MKKKTYRLKIAEKDFNELKRLVFSDIPKESGAFALAGIAEHANLSDIIVRRPIKIPKELLSLQDEFRLEISSRAINGLIALCEKNGLGAILCHSHPEDIPYSISDDSGERRIFEVLRQSIPLKVPTASLLFYPDGIRGRIWLLDSLKPVPISEIVIVGRSLRRIRPDASPSYEYEDEFVDEEIFDRHIHAFGKQGQALIARTKVGIVGIGGTGSPTAEQLVRLGVKDLILIDPDEFDLSNITRVYGTFASAIRQLRQSQSHSEKKPPKKVDLVASHLKKINPNAEIQGIPKNIVLQDAAAKLLDRDIVFLCTDDHWGRSVVNQIAYQYFIPTINLGVRIDARNGIISGARGVIDILRPDMPCLWCSQFLRADRIAAESMPLSARKSLEREGYVEGIETPAPSVISMTTALSGMAVTHFLQQITDFMSSNGEIKRLNYDIMDSTVSRGEIVILKECICSKVRGYGDLKDLPTCSDISDLEK